MEEFPTMLTAPKGGSATRNGQDLAPIYVIASMMIPTRASVVLTWPLNLTRKVKKQKRLQNVRVRKMKKSRMRKA
jgi:predicted carbohydrate-binding protein with CBM5 and CBM33 domain